MTARRFGASATTSAVAVGLTRILAVPWFRKLRTIVRSLHWIADSLDTDTPGGLADTNAEIAKLRAEVARRDKPRWEVD